MFRSGSVILFVLVLGACFDGTVIEPGSGGSGGASTTSVGTGISTTSSTAGGGSPGAGGTGGQGPCNCQPGPCETSECVDGRCVYTPRAPGEDCAGVAGVCQGGDYLGQCGQRISSRPFPASGAWSSQAVSEVFTGAGAPSPTGIVSAEQTTNGSRLFVFKDDGTIYERRAGAWQPPTTFAMILAAAPQPCPAVFAAPIASTVRGDVGNAGADLFITSTDESPTRFVQYEVSRTGGQISNAACGFVPDDSSQGGPMQNLIPAKYAFGDQRGAYATIKDAVTFFKVHQGTVYIQYSGQAPDDPTCAFCYDPSVLPEATSQLAIDGQGSAPAPGTVVAAFHDEQAGVLYAIGD
ncbi:MAG: hypothetical protein JNL21_35640 [Myxococcales bacterium]|nr:hypothetical protein [Myxococcales bacterium]